jgi:hypothetical protein
MWSSLLSGVASEMERLYDRNMTAFHGRPREAALILASTITPA